MLARADCAAFGTSWLLTLLLKWVRLSAAGTIIAVVLAMTALLVVVHPLTSMAAPVVSVAGTGLQRFGADLGASLWPKERDGGMRTPIAAKLSDFSG